MQAKNAVIIGGGPAGLSAGYVLSRNKQKVTVFEKGKQPGGLAMTLNWKGFLFDVGGHRFFTKNDEINDFVEKLMKTELIDVNRISRIYFGSKYFDYPLKPFNALLNLGTRKTIVASFDYLIVQIKKCLGMSRKDVSFEDWITNRFGNALYRFFFKDYTEKVWGIPCSELSADWASQRIKGMSLFEVVKNAFSFRKKDSPKSLIEKFKFPKKGIGRISEKLSEEIQKSGNRVELNSEVKRIFHSNGRITAVEVDGKKVEADEFLSSMPVTELILRMTPALPKEIIGLAKSLRYRDWMSVNLLMKQKRVTDDTWIYVHDKEISFGRIQQWANWSEAMTAGNRGSITFEIFANEGDKFWNMPDDKLISLVKTDVSRIGFMNSSLLGEGFVLRVKKAYPVYDIGYQEKVDKIKAYLKKFSNLQLIGRYGTFRYNNMDHSIEIGLRAAENVLGAKNDLDAVNSEGEYHEIKSET